MKEFSVRDIILFSQRIEQESYDYYMKAKGILKKQELQDFVNDLALSELNHKARLARLLNEEKPADSELDKDLNAESPAYRKLVNSPDINENSTTEDILKTAVTREENTRDLYKMMISLTNIDPSIVKIFEDLVKQEEGHANVLKEKLKKLN